MSEREPTAEELAFAEQFRKEVSAEPVAGEQIVEEGEDQSTDRGSESDESQFVGRLFGPKPWVEAFIRSVHGDGSP
jgi:hypothetical protein